MDGAPYDAWFSGAGPVDFGEGACEVIWAAHDTGSPTAVDDELSQYELSTFVIDPKFGAERTDEVQPWGLAG
jgi:hypothetical protein